MFFYLSVIILHSFNSIIIFIITGYLFVVSGNRVFKVNKKFTNLKFSNINKRLSKQN